MKQSLLKALDVSQRVWGGTREVAIQIAARLRSVNVDPTTAAVLCITLQMVLTIAVLVTFRTPSGALAKPLPGTSDCPIDAVDAAGSATQAAPATQN
jgi:hypothetical protein